MAEENDENAAATGACCLLIIIGIVVIIAWRWMNRPVSGREMRKFMGQQRSQTNFMVGQTMAPQPPPMQPQPQYPAYGYTPPPPAPAPPPSPPKPQKQRCLDCGSELENHWKMCPQCGRDLQEPQY